MSHTVSFRAVLGQLEENRNLEGAYRKAQQELDDARDTINSMDSALKAKEAQRDEAREEVAEKEHLVAKAIAEQQEAERKVAELVMPFEQAKVRQWCWLYVCAMPCAMADTGCGNGTHNPQAELAAAKTKLAAATQQQESMAAELAATQESVVTVTAQNHVLRGRADTLSEQLTTANEQLEEAQADVARLTPLVARCEQMQVRV